MNKSALMRGKSLQVLKEEGCLNSMEVCRIINGFEFDDFRDCYPRGDFQFKTRPERCQHKTRGCRFWSLSVYKALRQLWKKEVIQSIKCRAKDKGNNSSFKNTDIFRFWFIQYVDFYNRVLVHTLVPFLKDYEYKGL